MLEMKEVLRLWIGGAAKKQIARQVGLDPKTVRRDIEAAQSNGFDVGPEPPGLTDERLSAVLVGLRDDGGRPRGDGRAVAEAQRAAITNLLDGRVRLSKIRRLLSRKGVSIRYATLHRFAGAELDFGRTAGTSSPKGSSNPPATR